MEQLGESPALKKKTERYLLGAASRVHRRDSLKRGSTVEGLLRTRIDAKLADRDAEIALLRARVSELEAELATARSEIEAIDGLRRRAVEELAEARGKVRVFCRVRPSPDGQSPALLFPEPSSVAVVGAQGGPRRFNAVWRPSSSSQDSVFRDLSPYIDAVLDGFSSCIIAYGPTNSGKVRFLPSSESPHVS